MILDALTSASNIHFKPGRLADVAELKVKGRQVHLIKPSTYMNLSGKAVNYWMQQLKVPRENVLVVVDDLALPFGTLRLKEKGSDAGHNGLKNINEVLGTNAYPRLRFGIGCEFPKGQQVNYVLQTFNNDETVALPALIKRSSEIIQSWVTIGAERTMNAYNQ